MGWVLRKSAFLLVVCLVACREEPHHRASDAETRSFVDEVVRGSCIRRLKCATRSAEFSVANCEALESARLNAVASPPAGSDNSVLVALLHGSAHVWADRTAACLASFEQPTCDPGLTYGVFDFPPCALAIEGTRHAGEACRNELECVSPLECDAGHCAARGECRFDADCPAGLDCRWIEDSPLAPGHLACVAKLAAGASCRSDDECASGTCDDHTCADTVATLEPCESPCAAGEICERRRCVATEGQPCRYACAEGLDCLPPPTPFKCVRTHGIGESCAEWPCDSGLACRNGLCRAEDGPCDVDGDCSPERRCVAHACVAREFHCDDSVGCGTGTVCDDALAACVALPGVGEPCGRRCPGCPADRCEDGLVCDHGTCRDLVYRTSSDACPSGQICVTDPFDAPNTNYGYQCLPAPLLGEPCGGTACAEFRPACGEGVCRPDEHGNPICQPLPPERCGDEGACQAGEACWSEPSTDYRCRKPASSPPCPGCTFDPYGISGLVPRPAHGERCSIIDGVAEACAEPDDICVPLAAGGAKCLRAKGRGEPCTEAFECGGVLSPDLCDPATKRCVAGPADGEPCFRLREYATCDAFHAWCDRTTTPPTCRAIRGPGDKCVRHVECGRQLGKAYCADGLCRAW